MAAVGQIPAPARRAVKAREHLVREMHLRREHDRERRAPMRAEKFGGVRAPMRSVRADPAVPPVARAAALKTPARKLMPRLVRAREAGAERRAGHTHRSGQATTPFHGARPASGSRAPEAGAGAGFNEGERQEYLRRARLHRARLDADRDAGRRG